MQAKQAQPGSQLIGNYETIEWQEQAAGAVIWV